MTVRFLRDQLIAIFLALMSVFALRLSLPFSNMASRLAVDVGRTESGRWQILLHWIDGWLNTSVFWGQGWGVIPNDVAWAQWSKDPHNHNIYVQILADGGTWGVGLFVLAFIALFRSIKHQPYTLPSLVFAAGLFVYQGVDRIWAISSGLYLMLSLNSYLLSGIQLRKNLRRYRSGTISYAVGICVPLLAFALLYFSDGRP